MFSLLFFPFHFTKVLFFFFLNAMPGRGYNFRSLLLLNARDLRTHACLLEIAFGLWFVYLTKLLKVPTNCHLPNGVYVFRILFFDKC